MSKVVITFGTFDLLHPGHICLLKRARDLGDKLVVGVSTDTLNLIKGKRGSFYNENVRKNMVAELKCVDTVFKEESLEKKADYVKRFGACTLVMGDDWYGKFDWVGEETGCDVVYLKRTPGISTTEIRENKVDGTFLV